MKLSVNLMGLTLKNPIIVAAGPWSRGSEKILEAFEAGAGAVVTETIVSEPYIDIRPRLAYNGSGVQNIRMYTDISFEKWLSEISFIKRNNKDGILIASIMAGSPSEMGYMAKKVEKAGADAIELGLACPMGEGSEIIAANPEKTYDLTWQAVNAVDIPVMVKLTHSMADVAKITQSIEKAHGSGISAIDTVRSILGVDIETRKPTLNTYGGYSGAPIRPLGLASVASICQSSKLNVCGVGGIETFKNALEYIMLGATAVQLGTSVLLNGLPIIGTIIKDLEEWMIKNKIEDLQEIRGEALKNIRSFEEIRVEPNIANMKSSCDEVTCSKCINACIFNAMSFNSGSLEVAENLCSGCGLCVDICHNKKISLKWA